MILLKRVLIALGLVYLLPIAAAAAFWIVQDRPARWSEANWGSAGILPHPAESREAAVYVFSAKTGGLKGALASHAWIVTKAKDAPSYERYDKVGWGSPIRRNHRAADGYWYSNRPEIVAAVTGPAAEALIPKVEAAIAAYPHADPGGYVIWPGPNSNTFVAFVLRRLPELGAVLPSHAVGRDYLPGGAIVHVDPDGRDVHVSLGGLLGLSAGWRSGLELNLFGLVAGLDFARPGIKLPALGRFGI